MHSSSGCDGRLENVCPQHAPATAASIAVSSLGMPKTAGIAVTLLNKSSLSFGVLLVTKNFDVFSL